MVFVCSSAYPCLPDLIKYGSNHVAIREGLNLSGDEIPVVAQSQNGTYLPKTSNKQVAMDIMDIG